MSFIVVKGELAVTVRTPLLFHLLKIVRNVDVTAELMLRKTSI